MNVNSMNKASIQNLDDILYLPVTVSDVKKIEERPCYDAYWQVNTNYGVLTIKTYDGISYNELLQKAKRCSTISDILHIQPKSFYYD